MRVGGANAAIGSRSATLPPDGWCTTATAPASGVCGDDMCLSPANPPSPGLLVAISTSRCTQAMIPGGVSDAVPPKGPRHPVELATRDLKGLVNCPRPGCED